MDELDGRVSVVEPRCGHPGCAWWALPGEELRRALERVAHGEDAALVYLELYANANVERADGD